MANETEKKVEMKSENTAGTEGQQEKPKKKKLITVVRPQNSKGFVKAGQRPGAASGRKPARPAADAAAGTAAGTAAAAPRKGTTVKKGIAARTPEAARAAAYAKAKAEEARIAAEKAKAEAEARAAEEAVRAAQEAARRAEEERKAEAAARAAALARKEEEDRRLAEEAARIEANRAANAARAAAKAAAAQAATVSQAKEPAAPAPAPVKPETTAAPASKASAEKTQGSERRDAGRTAQRSGTAGREAQGGKNNTRGGAQRGGENRPARGGQERQNERGGSSRGGEGRQDRQDNNRGGRSFAGKENTRGGAAARGGAESGSFEKDSRKTERSGRKNARMEHGDKFDRRERSQNQGKGAGARPKNGAKPVKPAVKPVPKVEEKIKSIVLPETLTLKDLADKLKQAPAALVKKLFMQGKMVTVNEEIDFDTAEEIAMEYDVLCEKEEKVDVIAELLKEEEDAPETLTERPPVVCVMGHVDHGKTSLLDAIRNTHVIDREAGGITQHIGASVVTCNGKKITFLDTPGHEAFTSMRMRGANSTDIAILVVAADDGVMPQTVEAINHAKAAGIEIIVAINKIDKPGANVEKVKQELTEYELIPEDWGGSTVFAEVSAKTHEGIDNLLEMVLLTAEVMELKANANRRARGLVIEARLDKGKGPVATVLIQKGTLHISDPICAGNCYGRVRAMLDPKGRSVKEAGPSMPVSIVGFSNVPGAGEIMVSPETEKEARAFADTFISESKERLIEDSKKKMSLDDLFSQIQAGNLKELKLIVKADVQGSVEAVKQSLLKLSNDEVVVKVIHSGAGNINESDVILASASNAIIIGFNVKPDPQAKATSEQEGVDIRLYTVIYNAIEDVENAMKGMLDPIYEEKVLGHAQVRQTFRASGVGTIAGSYVLDGTIQRGCSARVKRGDSIIFDGPVASLKRFKDDVKEVKTGYECGIVFEKFNDVAVDDVIEAYMMVEVPR